MTDSWDEPEGIAPRGTVIVAAGRGETIGAYGRFGRRIAADGYRVRALPDVTTDAEAAFAAAGKLLVDDSLPGPKTVVGSDTGALFAIALAARHAPGLDAVVLAGLPAVAARATGVNLLGWDAEDLVGWEAEVEARTGCPTHRRVLGEGAAAPGVLFSATIPAQLTEYAGDGDLGVPVLGLHGEDDTISPLDQITYPGRLVTIVGGKHDVLNDLSHRTVAATVVQFLERLRLGADLPVIAREQS
jgi:alpha-beta hydrolase superfamily lysophospholipase